MIKFSPDRWEIGGFDFTRRKTYQRGLEIWARLDTDEGCPKKIAILPRNPRITEEEEIANACLIAAAPEMYELLREELIPTSDYGGIVSLERERKVKKLLARIDGEAEDE